MSRLSRAHLLLVMVAGLPAAACATLTAEEVDLLHETLAVQPGATVADIGAGRGEIAFALARSVGPAGRVYATEIDPHGLEDLAQQASELGLTTVSTVAASETSAGLADACCTAILMRRVYHHLTHPDPTVASVRRALRPGGRFVVVDFRPSFWLALSTPNNLPEDRQGHGIRPELVTREVERAGFQLIDTIDDWPGPWTMSHYGLVFRRGERTDRDPHPRP